MPIRILHLDDSPIDAQLIAMALDIEQAKFPTVLTYVQNKSDFLAALQRKDFDIILSDYRMPGFDGDEALRAAQEQCQDIPFIMVTGELGEELVIETLQRGATDYVLKDRIFRLIPAIKRALAEAENNRKRRDAEQQQERLLQEVQRSRNELLSAFQAMSGGVLVFDMEGNVVFVNAAEAKILGYPDTGAMMKDLAYFSAVYELRYLDGRIVPYDDWPVAHVLRGESVVEVELRGKRTDTNQEWFFSFSGEPVRDETGKQIQALVITRDITASKTAELNAQNAQKKTNEILESIQDTFYAVDSALRITYANRRAEEVWQRPRAQMMGHMLWDEFPELVGTQIQQEIEHASRDHVAVHFEAQSPVVNRWIEVHVYPAGDGGLSIYFRDIEERKSQEKALRSSEERFASAFRLSPYPLIISHASDGTILDANEAFCALIGWKKEDILGRRSVALGMFGNIADREYVVQRIQRDGSVSEFETLVVQRTGGVRIVLLSACLLDGGEEQTLLTILHDITLERETREELQKSHQQLFEILESIQDAFFALSANGRFTYVNTRAEKFWSKDRNTLIGKLIWEEFPEAVGSDSYKEIERVMRERTTVHFEAISPVHGTWISVNVYPTAEGGVSVYFRDIAERKRAEDLLRRKEERFQSLITSSREPVAMVDEKGILLAVSDSAARLLGSTPSGLVDKDVHRYIPTGQIEAVKRALLRLSAKPEAPQFVLLHIQGERQQIPWIELEANAITTGSQVQAYFFRLRPVLLGGE